jgi:Ca-activated chloride channel family protein
VSVSGAVPRWTSARRAAEDGARAYSEKRFTQALEAFDAASRLDRNSAVATYNAAAALFQLGRFDDARERYAQARKAANPVLRAKIDYALGNTEAALGNYKEAIPHYDACLAADDSVAVVSDLKRDARINRAFATSRLPPPATPDESGDRTTKGQPPKPKAGGSGGESPPSPSGQPPGDTAPPGGNPPESSAKPGATNPSTRERSPDADLDSLLSQVRKAQAARGTEPPPGMSGRADHKDW